MESLARDWLLDPMALLFLLSMLFGLRLIFREFLRDRRRSQGGRGHRSKNRRRGAGWAVAGLLIWMSAYLFSSAPVIVNPLVAQLESQYPPDTLCPVGSHLVVLGGGVDSRINDLNEFDRMSPATLARATAAAQIANGEAETRLILAGGALRIIAEADVISAYLQQLGVDANRIVTEKGSVNTRENAINVAQLLVAEELTGPVRILTSAMHMPRALGSFRKLLVDTGISVCPVSVDEQQLHDVPAYAWMPQTTALNKFNLWLHETVALIHYRIKGWV